MKTVFKYCSDGNLQNVFVRDGFVGIKCSLPQDYNDPFELFLGVDLEQGSDLLATYREVVEEVPQLLTTCFSKSPIVAPMWAHYGNNHQGFVIGFDVEALEKHLPNILIRDISYREAPSKDLISYTQMAARRMKPRDAMALRDAVLYHAYFSKYLEWSYEQEVRAVNLEDAIENIDGHSILYVPAECITIIIAGAKSSDEAKQTLDEVSAELNAEFYNGRIGCSFPTPYLTTHKNNPLIYADGEITKPQGVCIECSEPLKAAGELCPWCTITEDEEIVAASNNPLRILHNHDLLNGYLDNYPYPARRPYK
jgi:hypothetical protein